jgi:putative holliday junction resolvase
VHPSHTEVIGLDPGQVHTGVARASLQAGIAQPLAVLSTANLASELERVIKTDTLAAIIIGLPRGLDGQETQQTAWTRQWRASFEKHFNVPIHWQDEALTSQAAGHSEAAARILQDWLDERKR